MFAGSGMSLVRLQMQLQDSVGKVCAAEAATAPPPSRSLVYVICLNGY